MERPARSSKINPRPPLPGEGDHAVHRSDGSGTTFNFTHYLSQVSPGWKSKFGEGTTVSWHGGIGGKGNEGVAAYVKQIPYSIGYVEYAYVDAEQDGVHADAECRRQVRRAERRSLRGRGRHAPTGRTRKDFNLVMTNAPGANVLSDHRDDLRPDVQAAEECSDERVRSQVLQLGTDQGAIAGAEPGLCAAAGAAGEAHSGICRRQHPLSRT